MNNKSKQDRLIEILEIRKKLNNLGLSEKVQGIKELFDIMSLYVKNGNPVTGKIKIIEAKRIFIYNFPQKIGNKCSLTLKLIQ